MLSFNSVVCSLGVCVCIYTFMRVYTAQAYDRIRFDGFLTLRAMYAFVLTRVCVSPCVGVWVSERSLHIVIQETHMIACDWGVRHSRRPAQTVQRAGAAKAPGCKRPSAAQKRQVALEASGRWCVVSSLESRRRTMLKLPCGFSASLSRRRAQLPARGEKWKVKGPEYGML